MPHANGSTNQGHQCPGCSSEELSGELECDSAPVVLNYRFATAQDALAVPRRCVSLRQCGNCGLVFNSTFDPDATPYDERYENTQCCSSAFQTHLDSIAGGLATRYRIDGERIVEVGCGKGDFLKLICEKANSIGYGYDTSCELSGWTEDRSVCFHQRYIGPGEISEPVALVVCRHVVEHVPAIGEFFRLLFAISVEGGNAPVYIETPDWDWIVEHVAHWDIFYEHCNYLSTDALANLAMITGFDVIRHVNEFGGQYQALEIRPSTAVNRPDLSIPETTLSSVAPLLTDAKNAIADRIRTTYNDKSWAIWGAGAKGVCLANTIQSCPPDFVIDANPAKQGGYIAGTDRKILSPNDARLRELDAVLVANPNYVPEIESFARENGLSFSLDSI